MRRERTLSRVAVVVGDFILINIAFMLAYWMRYILELGREVAEQFFVTWAVFIPIQLGVALVLVLSSALFGLYSRDTESPLDDSATILGATSVGAMFTLAVVFLSQGYAYSRLLFFYTWLLSFVLLSLSRVAGHLFLGFLRARGIATKRVIVVGSDTLGKMVMNLIASEPGRGYRLVGFVADDAGGDFGRFKWLGRVEDLGDILQNGLVDEVFVAAPSASRNRVMEITQECQRKGLPFKIVPDLYEISLSGVAISDLAGIPLIGMKPVSIQGVNLFLKRTMDLVIAMLLLVLMSPLWLIIALAIKLTSSGPVLFKQERLGKGGRPFTMYKFRSMRVDAEREMPRLVNLNEAVGPIFKIRRDPRLTAVGRILRRVSLDELPQLINVLKGEMSLVGPRPPLATEAEMYHDWHWKRLETAPGVTGLWQVSGRSEIPFDEMVMLDIYYIENWSPGLDLKIILRTIPAVLSGRGAY